MSDYASRQRNPRKHVVGLTVVVLFHLLLGWAISNGLAQKFVKVIQGPVQAQLLEEQKPDIPPPPPPPPPPPKEAPPPPPPPAYVPPVDVNVNAPASNNALAAVSNTPQPAAPPAPPPPPAPPAPPVRVPPQVNASACEKPAYPPASRRAEEEGTVTLRFLIDVDGKVIDSQVEATSGFKRLDEAARGALSRCVFKPATVNGQPEQAWASMKYTWRLE